MFKSVTLACLLVAAVTTAIPHPNPSAAVDPIQLQRMLGAGHYIEELARRRNDLRLQFPGQERYPSEVDLPTPEMILELGYPVEVHHVTTEDGYILELHRIPYGKGQDPSLDRTPAFLQHGLLCSSSDWVITGDKKGLSFLLADAGYDVWMGNIRGNTYSRGHVNPNITEKDYWNYSFDDHGRYDVPAMIDHVLETTGKDKVFWAAHSMGTMMFWIAMDYHGQELADKFLGMFALGPVAKVYNMVSPLRLIAPFANSIEWVLNMLGLYEFLPSSELFEFLATFFCEDGDWFAPLCQSIIFLICGFNPDQLDPGLVPYIVGHTPAGTSTKNVIHFAQGVNRDGFLHFDYGKDENLEVYGQEIPPSYDITKTTVPVFLFYGANDWLAVPKDVEWLKMELPRVVGSFLVNDENFNHLDFLWAIDAVPLLYNDIMRFMDILNPISA